MIEKPLPESIVYSSESVVVTVKSLEVLKVLGFLNPLNARYNVVLAACYEVIFILTVDPETLHV